MALNPLTDCPIDHDTLLSEHLVADGGARWHRCPSCNVMVEPKMATGQPSGPNYGPGRNPYTDRQKWEHVKLRSAWLGGYYES
jgi:hypothetical protein